MPRRALSVPPPEPALLSTRLMLLPSRHISSRVIASSANSYRETATEVCPDVGTNSFSMEPDAFFFSPCAFIAPLITFCRPPTPAIQSNRKLLQPKRT